MTRTMTRSFTGTFPLHYQHAQANNFPKKAACIPFLTRTLICCLKNSFDSSESADLSALTIIPADFHEKSFVHFTSHLTTTAAACQNQAHFLTRTRIGAYSLDYHFITFKIVIL
jgi:hypothetical protein